MSKIFKVDNKEFIFDEFTTVNFKIVGTSNEIIVKLGKPQKDPTMCYCPYQIDSPYGNILHYSAGGDELKSIQMAMSMLNADLQSLAKTNSVILQRYGHREGDLGFEEYDILFLARRKAELKYNKSLSSNEREKLEARVRLLEEQMEKHAQARYSPEMQAMREKRDKVVKEIKEKR